MQTFVAPAPWEQWPEGEEPSRSQVGSTFGFDADRVTELADPAEQNDKRELAAS
jgi:hypothetical protein